MSKVKFSPQPTDYIDPFAKGGVCVPRSLMNEKLHGLDVQWGTLLVFDRGLNKLDTMYNFHVWNTNEAQDTIYDNFEAIYYACTEGIASLNDPSQVPFIMKHPSEWTEVRVVDGSNIKCEGNCLKKINELTAHYSKVFKNVDAVYITDFSADFKNNEYRDWDQMNDVFDEVEANLPL